MGAKATTVSNRDVGKLELGSIGEDRRRSYFERLLEEDVLEVQDGIEVAVRAPESAFHTLRGRRRE